MTREQAKREIDDIDFYLQHHTDDYSERSHDAMMMAIQALSQEQISLNDINNALGASFRNGVRSAKVEQEPCDDAISRQAVLDGLKGCICEDWVKTLFATMVKQLPSVTQKSGKWINTADACMSDNIVCSKCGYNSIASYNYCPNCGAKMVEPQESEDKG